MPILTKTLRYFPILWIPYKILKTFYLLFMKDLFYSFGEGKNII